jgi:hypothetical protein
MLHSHVTTHIRDDAPAFARQVALAAARELPIDVADIIGFVTLKGSCRLLTVQRGEDSATVRRAGL